MGKSRAQDSRARAGDGDVEGAERGAGEADNWNSGKSEEVIIIAVIISSLLFLIFDYQYH
jgi:hypothetical protein